MIHDDSGHSRLISLDLFRGVTIAAMIVVNNQGDWSAVYTPFRHAPWHGWLGADLVFPFFLFAAGASIQLSLSAHIQKGTQRSSLLAKIARRTLILVALGLFLNLFPFFNFATVRIPGVLQRIGLCYFFSSLIYLYAGKRLRAGIPIMLLICYAGLLVGVTPHGFGHGSLDPCCTLPGYLDGSLFPGHTYEHAPAPGFDPEGLLSTIPAIASTMIGVAAASMARASMDGTMKRWIMPAAGCAAAAAGAVMDGIIPVNKNLWTPSYVLLTGGLAVLLYSAFHYVCDIRSWRRPAEPFLVLGKNAIVVYVLSSMAGKAMISFSVAGQEGPTKIKNYIFNHAVAPWFEPAAASLLYATAFLLFWWLIMYILYRKKIFISL